MLSVEQAATLYILLASAILLNNVAAAPASPIGSPQSLDAERNYLAHVNDSISANSYTSFPAAAWLGFGLDMTRVMPLDITAVREAVTRSARLINLNGKPTKSNIPGLGWTYPDSISVVPDVGGGQGELLTFTDGESASSALKAGGQLEAQYKVVKGDATVDAAVQRQFSNSYQYGIFDFHRTFFDVGFAGDAGYQQMVAEDRLFSAVHRLPRFNPLDKSVVRVYRDLFSSVGTHVIVGMTYGARLTFTYFATNSNTDVNNNFKGDINVALDGLPVSGKVDAHLKTTSQYKAFVETAQQLCSCDGGDATLAVSICARGGHENLYDVYTKWATSATMPPAATAFQVAPIWALMRNAKSDQLASYANAVEEAFYQLSEHPQVHYTTCTLIVSSDWAEIGLLSPSAYIDKDPNAQEVPGTVLSSTKVNWQSADGRPGRFVTIGFIIRNYGDPVDLELSHGSNGATPITGEVSLITANGCKKTARGITDNGWNSIRFTCDVDPKGLDIPLPAPQAPLVISGSDNFSKTWWLQNALVTNATT